MAEDTSYNSDKNFWYKQFEPRTKKWQRETLRKLKNPTSADLVFSTAEQRQAKIDALNVLLKK
jgi:predicted alpha/beta hydrolase family esterase